MQEKAGGARRQKRCIFWALSMVAEPAYLRLADVECGVDIGAVKITTSNLWLEGLFFALDGCSAASILLYPVVVALSSNVCTKT
jgi:hypothetical protein